MEQTHKFYKWCFVESCTNNCKNTPEKVFITVPRSSNKRKKWFKAVGKNVKHLNLSTLFCCEDHFDLPNDMENYMRVKLMGGKIRMKDSVVPHKCLGKNLVNVNCNVNVQMIKVSAEDIEDDSYLEEDLDGPEIKTEVIDIDPQSTNQTAETAGIKIKEENLDEEEIQNNCSMFATEPIFESILTKQEESDNSEYDYDYEKNMCVNTNDLYEEPIVSGKRKTINRSSQTRSQTFVSSNQKHKSTQSDLQQITPSYKKCFVPTCSNTSLSDIKKVFVKVQLNNIIYKKWAEKFGSDSFQSVYIFCEDHFNLPKDTSNWAAYVASKKTINLVLKANARPKLDKSMKDKYILSYMKTKAGRVACVRPLRKYSLERDLCDSVKSETYEMKNKFVCDVEVQCHDEELKEHKQEQIYVHDTSGKLLYCSLPGCPSTNADAPKIFFSVPDDNTMLKWSKSLGISINKCLMSHSPYVHCCEDHFNEVDKVDDWEKYKSEGCKVTVSMNEDKRKDSKTKATAKKRKFS